MNQALKYEELEKIFFTKAPITDTSIWLLKLDPDCQNNPIEKALSPAILSLTGRIVRYGTTYEKPEYPEIHYINAAFPV